MERSLLDGFMAVVAASGSVVFLALQVHKRLLSDFMKKLELEIGPPGKKMTGKKKKSARKGWKKRTGAAGKVGVRESNPNGSIVEEIKASMPSNRLALYKGIIEFKSRRGSSTWL